MRLAAIALVAVLAACHPPTLRSQARLLGHRFVATGQGIAHLAGRVSVTIDPRVKVAATQVAVASVAQAAAEPPIVVQQPVAHEPVAQGDTVQNDSGDGDGDGDGEAPVADSPPAAQPAPAITVHRVDASRPTTFRMNYRNSSGTWTCSSYSTMDECTRTCTSMAQQAGMSHGQDPQCNCVEDVACP